MNVTNELFQAIQRRTDAKAAPQTSRDGGESAFERLLSQRGGHAGGTGEDSAQAPLNKDGAPEEDPLRQQLAAALWSETAALVQFQTPETATSPQTEIPVIPAEAAAAFPQVPAAQAENGGAQFAPQTQQTAHPDPAEPATLPAQQMETSGPTAGDDAAFQRTETAGEMAPRTRTAQEPEPTRTDPQSPLAQDPAHPRRAPAAANTQDKTGEDAAQDTRQGGGKAPALEKEHGGMRVTAESQIPAAEAQPLFRGVEAAPVKVGEAPVLDTRAADMDAKLTETIETQLSDGAQKVRIRLNPENLGTVTVDLTRGQDGSLQVVLHTTTEKAAALLSEHSAALGALLQGGTQANVQVEVQRQSESQQNQHQQQNQDPDQQRHGQNPDRQDRRQSRAQSEDFMHQLRLGLVSELVS